MTILEKNLKYLKLDTNEDLKSYLEECDTDNYVIEHIKEDLFTLKIKRDKKFMYLNSKYDPIQEIKRYLNELEIKQDDILIFLGGGLGYLAKELLKIIHEDNQVIICEPDVNIFKATINHIDMQEVFSDNRIKYFVENDVYKMSARLAHHIGFYNLQKVNTLNFFPYIDIFEDLLNDLRESIVEELNSSNIAKNTITRYSAKWFENSMLNYKHILTSHSHLIFKNMFQDKPIIIVSAGPSLNKNVELLKRAKGKAVILCVYTALKVLDNHNIRPDFIISLDGNQIVYESFTNIKYDIPLLYLSITNHVILDTHTGNKVFTLTTTDRYVFEMFKKYNKQIQNLKTGGSVACLTTDFAYSMGGNPIVFVGQDLAYPNNKTHADGTYYDGKNDAIIDENEVVKVKDVFGDEIYTDEAMFSFLKWFTDYISSIKEQNPNIKFIDATEGGAYINGTTVLTLEEVINTYCVDDLKIDDKLADKFSQPTIFDKNELSKIIEELEDTKLNLTELLPSMEEGIKLSLALKKLYKHNDNPKNKSVLKIIDAFKNVDSILETAKSETSFLTVLTQNISNELSAPRQQNISDGLYISNKSYILYSGVKQCIIDTIPIIEKTVAQLNQIR